MNKSVVLAADPSRLAASRLRFRCSSTSSTFRAGSRRSLPSGRLDHENDRLVHERALRNQEKERPGTGPEFRPAATLY